MPGIPEDRLEKEPPEAPAAPTPRLGGKLVSLLPTLGILLGLAAAAFALVLFVVRPLFPALPTSSGGKPRPAAEKFGRVVTLDSVVVNVAQTEGRRYLKATVQIEIPGDDKVAKEVEARKPQLLDLLVATLTQKSLAEVTAVNALDRLRSEVQERMGQELGREKIRRIFITEFVVQ